MGTLLNKLNGRMGTLLNKLNYYGIIIRNKPKRSVYAKTVKA